MRGATTIPSRRVSLRPEQLYGSWFRNYTTEEANMGTFIAMLALKLPNFLALISRAKFTTPLVAICIAYRRRIDC